MIPPFSANRRPRSRVLHFRGRTPPSPKLEIEASEWLIRLLDRNPAPDDPDFDTAARSASFEQWIGRSTEHEDAFIRVCKAYQKTAFLKPQNRLDIESLRADRHSDVAVASARSASPRRSFRERAPVVTSLVMAVLALVLSYWLLPREVLDTPEYLTTSGALVTQLGEYRCNQLPDGSSACLNTNSEVHYTFTAAGRSIELVSGEACFTVAKQDRPFYVRSGGISVRDLSTSFDVYRKRNSTLVTVVQGSIEIAQVDGSGKLLSRPVRFHKSQQVEFVEGGVNFYMRKQLTDEDLDRLLAWRQGRIDVTGRTLRDALVEFSRYQSINQFEFTDPDIARIRLSGNMALGNLDDFLVAVETEFGLRYTKSGSGENTVVTFTRRNNVSVGKPSR